MFLVHLHQSSRFKVLHVLSLQILPPSNIHILVQQYNTKKIIV